MALKVDQRIEKLEERGFGITELNKRQIEVEEFLKERQPEINGWRFETCSMSGTWQWFNSKIDEDLVVFATLYHEDEMKLPVYVDFDEADPAHGHYSEEFYRAPAKCVSQDLAYYLKKMAKVLPEIEALRAAYMEGLRG